MIDKKIKNFIRAESIKNSPRESCGFIVEKDNKISCVKTKNIAEDPISYFQISAIDFLQTKKQYDNILYVYHNHLSENFDFSELDILTSDNLNIPLLLYIFKDDSFKTYYPTSFKKGYTGKCFKIKENDCFTFIKEYFLNEFNINIQPITENYSNRIEAQKILDENLKLNFLEKNGFYKVENMQILENNDILLISTRFGKHFAIYIGNNKIIHQPIFGFSKIENYCNFYRRHTVSVYRRKAW
jgi:proteasome lid subunit RPN8/RPN11